MACEDLAREALDVAALEAAAKASYEYEGDRRGLDYLGWSDEPESVRAQWRDSVRLPIATYQGRHDAIGSGVKALEWQRLGDSYVAATAISAYEVLQFPPFGEDELLVRLNGANDSGIASWHRTLDEAKAAAQADFERRVLACLSTHTAAGARPVGEAVAWRDIATAPQKWGQPVLLWDGRTVFEGYWGSAYYDRKSREYVPAWVKHSNSGGVKPTHWAPLPAGPGVATRPVQEPSEVERLVQETGSSSGDDLRDMALVGHSLMEVIGIVTADGPYRDWTPADNPTEIVTDLISDLVEARSELDETCTRADTAEAALAETRERLEKVKAALRWYEEHARIGGDSARFAIFRDDHGAKARAALKGDA